MKKGKKDKFIKRHAKMRLKERFGSENADRDLQMLEHQMKNGKLKFLEKQSNTRTHFEFELNGKVGIAVYDKPRHSFVTFLFKE